MKVLASRWKYLFLLLFSLGLGGGISCSSVPDDGSTDAILFWNQVAIDASGLDHTPVPPGDPRTFGEQLGPGRSSRALAIVQIAIFEAVNSIFPKFQSYTGLSRVGGGPSVRAAIAVAAFDTLVDLWPSQATTFQDRLDQELAAIPEGSNKSQGIDLGHRAAASILTLRTADGSQHPEPRYGIEFIASDEPGKWRQDPISLIPLALGAEWGGVTPFVLSSADQFRVPPPAPNRQSGVCGRLQ